ncbi:bactofilin family protein [Undibacter mobilis]|uniref:Polymer-forming cytoskeletal protein n=1 Tax=Undibacter mobilis TaxID=2292256 RepID=A0A371B8Y1_9BRAD|nr:polymer-forming cytoskeletal protein [Undibacter mobilis]RDV04014.1 polymer-forming cytoskeletal protein [Undibacter mobilis]
MSDINRSAVNKNSLDENTAYIGEGVVLKGEISVPDTILVDGRVEGEVTAKTIRVGATGSVAGTVRVTEAEIKGQVSEKIEVKQLLTVRTGGVVNGAISYGEIELERGSVISGEFISSEHRAPKSQQKIETAHTKVERIKFQVPGVAVVSAIDTLKDGQGDQNSQQERKVTA